MNIMTKNQNENSVQKLAKIGEILQLSNLVPEKMDTNHVFSYNTAMSDCIVCLAIKQEAIRIVPSHKSFQTNELNLN